MNAPGWQPDPTARHEYRYWDGSQWTDDVSDGGVTSTDPVDGSGAAGGPDPDATQAIDPATQVYQGGPSGPPADQGYPSGQYPPGTPAPGAPGGPGYGYDSGQGYPSGQGYGGQGYGGYSGGGMPPGQPAKKGPNTVLIAVIALVAVLAIGGAAFALTSGGDDDEGETSGSTTTTTAADTTTTTEEDVDDTTTTTEEDDADDTTTTTAEDGGSGEDPSAVVGLLAEGVQQGAPNLTDEQAECIAQAMVDELGEEQIFDLAGDGTEDPFASLSAEQQAALTSQMLECAPADAFLDPGTGA